MKVYAFLGFFMAGLVASATIPRGTQTFADPDEAVVYPAKLDQSWVDARTVAADPDEAVVYPAKLDQSWVDATQA
ncbi:hypothetical protein F4777DRAFT_226474 [Nemania sp. FL0916]|nr:hypothetical protein F4777DRAFT_226474 [Nemania sp. FL0916]